MQYAAGRPRDGGRAARRIDGRSDLHNVSNFNYACPRIGDAQFVHIYQSHDQDKATHTRTLRIQNTRDRVPCLPPKDWGYEHATPAYLIDFHKDGWVDLEFLLHNHAATNYLAVLQCVMAQPDGICERDDLHVPDTHFTLISRKPDPDDICSFWL